MKMSDYRLFYSPDYYAEIGDEHVFPIKKFELVRDILLKENTILEKQLVEPDPAAYEDLNLVHTNDYLDRLIGGRLTKREVRVLGLPWTESLVRRSLLAVSGTINASRNALKSGVATNLAGGTHHAFPDRGEGFCVFNDVAVSIEVLLRDQQAKRFLIIDCDVHQGNATASIFQERGEVFTFSMHGKKNYPLRKEASDLDIELDDETGDDVYLETLDQALPRLIPHEPDLIFYLGGADPFEDDQLGRLAITKEGLKERDRIVLDFAKREHIPVVTVMSGGYAKQIEDTVDIHCNTVRAVTEVFGIATAQNA